MKTALHPLWEKVLEELWQQSRFCSYFYQGVDFVENKFIPTLALSISAMRPVLFYNSDFIEEQDKDMLKGLLIHELFHIVNRHEHRQLRDHEPYMQNLAQDMLINSFLQSRAENFFSYDDKSEDLKLSDKLPYIPEAFFHETKEKDPSWEDIYSWFGRQGPKALVEFKEALSRMFKDLKSDKEKKAENPPFFKEEDEDLKDDEIKPEGIYLIDEEGKALPSGTHLFLNSLESRQLKNQLNKVMDLAVKDSLSEKDRVFEALKAMIKKLDKLKKTSWEKNLRSIVDRNSYSSSWIYSRTRFNRRYLPHGIYASGRRLKEKELLSICVDVSSSMTSIPGEMARIFGVIESMLDRFTIKLLCIDEDIFIPRLSNNKLKRYSSDTACFYRKGDWKHLESANSGTTFFAPLFNDYIRGHRELLIVITDGYIHDLAKLQAYSPCLWLISSNRKEAFNPPFGKVIHME